MWKEACAASLCTRPTLRRITRREWYVKRNIEALSCNHCAGGRAISNTYSECVFVALGIQHATRLRHIVIRGLPGSYNIFPRFLINGKIFEKKKLLNKKICVLIFSTTFVRNIFHSKKK